MALVILAFSLRGVPEPVEPPPGTLEFDASAAAKTTRDVLAIGESRRPGSGADHAVADLVAERFGAVVAGEAGEQVVEATIEGEDVELRNITLTLPGNSGDAIVVVAGRDSREGAGAPSSAAATGVLLELMTQLSVASRDRTIILASTSGASAEAQGVRELIKGLPERTNVESVVVVSQPGFDEPFEPHVITAAGLNDPPIGLALSAEAILRSRTELEPGGVPPFAQIARYAIPAASGEQAALIDDGLDAVALSSAGEVPLPPGLSGRERLDSDTLELIGSTALGLISALDSAPGEPAGGPGRFVRAGDNLVPGWTIALVAFALLLPPLAVTASILAGARRASGGHRRALAWALEWWLPAAVLLFGTYVLGIVGVFPSVGVPYDPGSVEIGVVEGAGMLLLAVLAGSLWWALHLRRPPSPPGPRGAGAAAGLVAALAALLVWFANPYLALLLAPLVHVVSVLGSQGRRPAALALPILGLAALPLTVAIVYVASELDWGTSAPLQLAALVAGGGIGPFQALGSLLVLSSVAAVVVGALATGSSRAFARKTGVGSSGGA